MKDELKGKIMTRFDALRPKTLCYLTDLQTNKQTKKILLPPTLPVLYLSLKLLNPTLFAYSPILILHPPDSKPESNKTLKSFGLQNIFNFFSCI